MASVRTQQHVVTIEQTLDEATITMFFELYARTFAPLSTKAVQRHLLREDEFRAEMRDPRIHKYLVRDEHGTALAMCTLTNHLEAVHLISPEYFAHHYPEQAARQAVYYLGFSLVSPLARRERLFTELIMQVTETVVADRGVCAYDICSWNNTVVGLAGSVQAMLEAAADIDVQPVDAQTYYAAVVRGPMRSGGSRRVPVQRPTLVASP